jgi:hypothetical protein
VRLEHARVDSAGDADPAAAQFGAPARRSFALHSVSLGNVWKFAPAWSLSTTLASTERAPTSFELYANGVHAATGAYERGDASLGAERGAISTRRCNGPQAQLDARGGVRGALLALITSRRPAPASTWWSTTAR